MRHIVMLSGLTVVLVVGLLIDATSSASAQTRDIPCASIRVDLPPHTLLDTSNLNWSISPPVLQANQAIWQAPNGDNTGRLICIYDSDVTDRFSAFADTPPNFTCEVGNVGNKVGVLCTRRGSRQPSVARPLPPRPPIRVPGVIVQPPQPPQPPRPGAGSITAPFVPPPLGVGGLAQVPGAGGSNPSGPSGDAQAGQAAFGGQCAVCHTVAAVAGNGIGPNLAGIFDKSAGNAVGYNYSPAVSSSGIIWDQNSLDGFLANPAAFLPGNIMPFGGIGDLTTRENIIAYLATL